MTKIEQMVSSLATRVASLEANATSCTVLGGRVDEAESSARRPRERVTQDSPQTPRHSL